MRGRVNYNRLVEQLQCDLAPQPSNKERPYNNGKRHAGCEGHGCNAACGYHGYCDYKATRYYYSRKGQAESQNSKEARHTYYRREMRLGYDNQDD